MKNIIIINKVIQSFFKSNRSIEVVKAKELMLEFIKAGIFSSNQKDGLPIRNLLRKLDKSNQLHLITHLFADRKSKNTQWYFSRNASNNLPKRPSLKSAINPTPKFSARSRKNSDEHYVIDLCDEILGIYGIRQHTFDFLVGDMGKNGRKKKLPIDVFYAKLNLVIEYMECQHTGPVNFFDKPGVITISGVNRREQRFIYDNRKQEVLISKGYRFIQISYELFECNSRHRIIRNRERDIETLKKYLSQFIKLSNAL